MDHADVRRGQEEKCRAQLLGKLAGQVEGHSSEVGVP